MHYALGDIHTICLMGASSPAAGSSHCTRPSLLGVLCALHRGLLVRRHAEHLLQVVPLRLQPLLHL